MRSNVTGILLALIGIGVLVAWRYGLFNTLLGKTGEADPTGKSVNATNNSGILDIVDRLRAVPLASSTTSPQSRGGVGLAENGFSSTYAPLTDPWTPGGFLDESTRARRRARDIVAGAESVTDAIGARTSASRTEATVIEKSLGLDSAFWFPGLTPTAEQQGATAGPTGAVEGSYVGDVTAV